MQYIKKAINPLNTQQLESKIKASLLTLKKSKANLLPPNPLTSPKKSSTISLLKQNFSFGRLAEDENDQTLLGQLKKNLSFQSANEVEGAVSFSDYFQNNNNNSNNQQLKQVENSADSSELNIVDDFDQQLKVLDQQYKIRESSFYSSQDTSVNQLTMTVYTAEKQQKVRQINMCNELKQDNQQLKKDMDIVKFMEGKAEEFIAKLKRYNNKLIEMIMLLNKLSR